MKQTLIEESNLFLLALQFLTRIPVNRELTYSARLMGESARYYPLVGVGIGLIAALLFGLLTICFPSHVAVVMTVSLIVLGTGALHEDGFADMCDGLGGGQTAADALRIMKDSRLGTYGVCALVLLLMLKLAALIALPVTLVPVTFVIGHCLSRASAVIVMVTSDYVRSEGTAKPVATGLARQGIVLVFATAGLIGFISIAAVGFSATLGAFVGVVLGHVAARMYFETRLGGYSGDCLGATQQLSEVGLYLGILACI